MNKRNTWRWLGLVVALVMVMGALPATARAQGPTPPTPEWAAIPKAAPETALDLAGNAAIQGAGLEGVSWRYVFSSSAGTYTPITGGIVHGTASNDDQSFAAIDIGFTFTYDGVDYTQVGIQSNGWIAMGGGAMSSSYYPLSTGTMNNVIAALARDLQGNGTTSELRSETIGTAPNRVFVVQWTDYKRYGSAYTGDAFDFQIRLYETTNVIEIVYGEFTVLYVASPPYGPQVGLRGPSNADFNNRTLDASQNWSASIAGTTNADSMTLTDLIYPANGLTYRWDLATGVFLDPPSQTGSDCRGSDVVWNVTVINQTGTAQSFNLSYSGNAWPTSGPATTGVIPDQGSEVIAVTVHIPWATNPGDSDTLTIDVADPTNTYTDTATVTTISALANDWQDYANMPVGREVRAPSVVYYDGKMYVIGGYGYVSGSGAARPWLSIYDIATDSWSTGADMPAGRYWLDCEQLFDPNDSNKPKIYCAGGYLTSATNTLYIYDIQNDSWSTGPTLPANRYNYSSVKLDNRYYVIGGYTTTYSAEMLVYDPATNAWSTLAPMNTARRYFHAGLIGGEIYVAGGYNGSYLSSAEVYDPATNAWNYVAAMPTPWVNGADGVKHDRFLVIAGGHPSSTAGASNGALVYDALTDTWDWLPLLDHLLYSAEGDIDGNGDFWYISGRMYENATYNNSPYTTRLIQCADCVPVSGADFTVTPPSPRPGVPATFQGSVAAGSPAISYEWDFGDGNTGSGQTVQHTYAAVGTYTVVMTATNCDGASTDVVSHDVVVASGPIIEVQPESFFDITLCPDTQTDRELVICNIGDEPLDYAISEVPATLLATPPAPAQTPSPAGGNPNRLEGIPANRPTAPSLNHTTIPLFVEPNADILLDGSFEAGSPNPYWGEYSLNYGTPLCTVAGCGTGLGTGPRTGSWWSWFGGINANETGWMSQTLTIPAGNATLSFWLEVPFCSDPNGYMEVRVDGTPLFVVYGNDPLCNQVGYVQQTLDVSAYADGGVHTIQFYSQLFGLNNNFMVDDVVLDAFSGDDIPWVSEDPTSGTVAAGSCQTVTVTFDATGLTPDTYTGTLQITSNDTQNPTIDVPLEMVVAGPPTDVDFTWNPLNPWTGQNATFTGSANSPVPATYDWDFGDTGTASGQTVQHAYSAAGDYLVTLTVTGCGVETAEHVVTVPDCTYNLPTEHFEGAFPPAGWQVLNNGGTCVWQRNDQWPGTLRPNYAGGQGFCADADSDKCGAGTTMNTELRTYALDLSGATTATLQYMTSFNYLGSAGEFANTDISIDGGATWTTLLHWAEDHSPNGPGEAVTLDLTPYTGYSNVLIRFHYNAPGWDWWWQVDQVRVGSCYLPDAVPDIDVTPTSLYQLLTPDQTADQTINVANLDLGHLNYSFDVGCGTPVSWLSVNPTSGWLPGYSDADATVTFDSTGLAIGTYNTNICVDSNDPDEPTVQIAATLEVTGTPDIEVTVPVPLDVTLCPDSTDTRQIIICNVGEAPLEWAIVEQPGLRVTDVTISTPSLSAAYLPEAAAELVAVAAPAGVAPATPSDWSAPEDVLYDNGPLVTHPAGCGTTDASRLQTSLGMNTLGFGHQYVNGYRMADDFTVTDPAGWQIDTITFFAYQTGAPSSPSPITGVYYQIWNGPPDNPASSVVFGDLTTNRLLSSTFSGIQRDSETTTCANNRYIFADVASAGVTLPPGTYWLDWMTDGSLSSGPWAPPVTILGQTTTGNGMQYTTAWAPALDSGTSTQQDLPFIIEGTVPGSQDITWLSEDPTGGTLSAGDCASVILTYDSTGLAPDLYTGDLIIESNDPDEPEIDLPVSLEVLEPVDIVSLTSNSPVVLGTPMEFHAVVNGALPIDLTWDFGGAGTPDLTDPYNPTFLYDATGTYQVTLTAENDCGLDVETITVEVIGEADIVVDPLALDAALCADETEDQTLTICNNGDIALDWSLSELPATARTGLPLYGPRPEAVLWDQPLSTVNQNAYVDQDFSDYPDYSSFLADDFVNTVPWMIDTIFVPGNGWNGFTTLFNASALTWQVYADCAGQPCGDPYGGGNPPFWTLTLPPTDAQVTITNGTGGMPSNTTLNLAAPFNLPPGHWWLIFYPTMEFATGGQFGRQPADTVNGSIAYFINPGGGFGLGTAWQPWSVIGATQNDIAFRLEGSTFDVPWLSEAPLSGSVPPGECVDVTVTFDATGLTPGDYFANLGIYSNDPDSPEVIVPVSLTVLEPVDIVSLTSNSPVIIGTPIQFHAVVNGAEPIDLTWDFGGAGTPDLTDPFNPTFLYDAPGIYTVVLEASNACGVDSASIEVAVIGHRLFLPIITRGAQ